MTGNIQLQSAHTDSFIFLLKQKSACYERTIDIFIPPVSLLHPVERNEGRYRFFPDVCVYARSHINVGCREKVAKFLFFMFKTLKYPCF